MATYASCRPWNSSSGWSFIKKNNGVDYYRGTFKDAASTPSTWAVYADFGSAVVTSKADYDSFVANTKVSGSLRRVPALSRPALSLNPVPSAFLP